MPSLISKPPLVMAQHAAPLQSESPVLRGRTSCSSCHTSLERSAKRFEAAVQARFHCGKGNAEQPCHLVNLQFFLEAQHEHLAINRGDFLQRCLNVFFSLASEKLVPGRRLIFIRE